MAGGLREWRPFEEAREFVRGLGLKNQGEWYQYAQGKMPEKGTKPDDIPVAPNRVYKGKGWVSWGDWLGTGNVAPKDREWRPFEEAREFVRSLGLKGESEWRKYSKGEMPEKGIRPKDIPTHPHIIYKYQGV